MFDIFYLDKKPNLFPHEQKINSIAEAQQLSRTRFFWIVNYLCDYREFDFLWEPVPWEAHQRHAWASQWQKDSGTYLIPKFGYTDTNYRKDQKIQTVVDARCWEIDQNTDYLDFDFSWHPDYTEPPYIYQFGTQWQKTGGPRYVVPGSSEIKYVKQSNTKIVPRATAVVEIDHLDNNAGHVPNTIKTVRYFDNYRDTLIRIATTFKDQYDYLWICSSICDYSGFDFSWHPEQWQSTMLHVFPSNDQKFGDTFFMHVPTFAENAEKTALLDWYDVNYVTNINVPRQPMPVIHHTDDTHVEAVKRTDWAGPIALFTTNGLPMTIPAIPLWRAETKTVMPLSPGASAVIVPKTAKGDIRTQLYDYPHIDKTQRKRYYDDPLDIVFIKNGEPNASSNYLQMQMYLANSSRTNKVHMVSGVNGRVAAYHAAAQASRTPWFFAVFAKLEVDAKFDWAWQPDRMQQPKHYIFHALNPVNGLVYGHQAMIAYNRNLVLDNTGHGLDFTLDSAHEVVPVLSGVARYNVSPWVSWRTAFREALKLCGSPDVESQYRLTQWLATPRTNVDNWTWSVWGAEDAVEYYQAVKGDFDQLRKSYDWAWLSSYALIRRNLTPDP